MVSSEGTLDTGLKAISDATRRGILGLLKRRQLSVLEISEEFPMSRPAISKHLRILKEAGLVLETPSGRQRLYALERDSLEPLLTWLAGFNGRSANGRAEVDGRRESTRRRSPSSVGSGGSREDWRVW